jgi:hypothetical protein
LCWIEQVLMDKSVGEWDQRVSSFILGLEEGPGEEEGQGQEQGQAVQQQQQQEQGVWGVEQLRRCGAFPSPVTVRLESSLVICPSSWLPDCCM